MPGLNNLLVPDSRYKKMIMVYNNSIIKKIGSIKVDAFLEENYTFTNTPTELPVEDGTKISDHIVSNNDTISITGFISSVDNDDYVAPQENFGIFHPMKRIKYYYNELLRLKEQREPIILKTGLDVYSNMIITSLSIPRDVNSGADLNFTMELTKLKIIKSQVVNTSISEAPDSSANDQIKETQDKGSQIKTEAETDEEKIQLAREIFEGHEPTTLWKQRFKEDFDEEFWRSYYGI